MLESPSSSFIPKRSPGQKPVIKRARNFVLLSMVSYALFISAPLASAAVFIYERHAQNQFNKAVVALDEAIVSFKEDDLARVSAFNDSLKQSKRLLSTHVSIVTLFKTLEAATAETVMFKNLDITRSDSTTLAVTALLSTPALDGALFQRATYNTNDLIKSPLFTNVQIIPANPDATANGADKKSVELKATFNFNANDILYKPLGSAPEFSADTITEPITFESTATEAETSSAAGLSETTL